MAKVAWPPVELENHDGTLVRFALEEKNGITTVHSHHTDWPGSNQHYQVSCYCWDTLSKLDTAHGERAPSETNRLNTLVRASR